MSQSTVNSGQRSVSTTAPEAQRSGGESVGQLDGEPTTQPSNDQTIHPPNDPMVERPRRVRRVGRALLVAFGLLVLALLLAFSSTLPNVEFVAHANASHPNAAPAPVHPDQTCTTTCQNQQVWQNGYYIWHPAYQVWVPGGNVYYPGHWEYHHDCSGCNCWHRHCEWVVDDDGHRERYCDSWYEARTCTWEWDWVNAYWQWQPGYWLTVPGYNEWVPGSWVTQSVCTEHCTSSGNWQKCLGNQSGGCSNLWCLGTCGPGANCECRDNNQNNINGSCDPGTCSGTTTCPNSQTGGSYWTCQDHQCIAVCHPGGNNNNNNNGGPTNTPVPPTNTPIPPTSTPVPTPTVDPWRTPTPIPQPNCQHPEDQGGTVKQVIPPAQPAVTLAKQPTYPVVVGQDATKRGADLTTQLSVGPCTLVWHYHVREDYVYCGPDKTACDCSKDSCEWRTKWVDWDNTCTEPYGLAGVTIDGKLSQDSINYINGPLQTQYPGVKVYQGAYRFFPSALAQQTQYLIANPTIWAMTGTKYPLEDPGYWDITVNVVTQKTAHCGPLSWSIPFPKWLSVYARDETITH